jgi:hypothetical protein
MQRRHGKCGCHISWCGATKAKHVKTEYLYNEQKLGMESTRIKFGFHRAKLSPKRFWVWPRSVFWIMIAMPWQCRQEKRMTARKSMYMWEKDWLEKNSNVASSRREISRELLHVAPALTENKWQKQGSWSMLEFFFVCLLHFGWVHVSKLWLTHAKKSQSVGAQVWQKTIQSMWNQATAAKKAQLDANTVALDDCWDPRCGRRADGKCGETGNVEITKNRLGKSDRMGIYREEHGDKDLCTLLPILAFVLFLAYRNKTP